MRKSVVYLMFFGTALLSPSVSLSAQGQESSVKITSDELAIWLNTKFSALWKQENIKPAQVVDDGTFLRRVYLDLTGTIPSVSQARDFFEDSAPYKRRQLVDDLLQHRKSSLHLARVWRRLMVPRSSPNARLATQLEPWLNEQFRDNVPYDEFARKLISARPNAGNLSPGETSPVAFYQSVGSAPDALATSFTRLFLGVRIGCAKCHDHPFTDWKQGDFWGMAAYFAGVNAANPLSRTITERKISKIADPDSGKEYSAQVLWGEQPKIPPDSYPRQVLAEWMTSGENTNFAATAVNRVWQQLCGTSLVGSIDDLDLVTKKERALVLDELAQKFVQSGFDMRWLIEGVCKSNVYQRASLSMDSQDSMRFASHRPLKTLTPEQVFDSLEQALSLPISNNNRSPRFNGQRIQMVARLDEAFADSPDEFQAGIPQALMMMNGQLTNDAISLERSRTLRAVVDVPFMKPEQRLETLFLATFTRRPRPQEVELLLEHVTKQTSQDKQEQAYAEIFWGLLNSPEFVLSR